MSWIHIMPWWLWLIIAGVGIFIIWVISATKKEQKQIDNRHNRFTILTPTHNTGYTVQILKDNDEDQKYLVIGCGVGMSITPLIEQEGREKV